jgi:hypothetical protein
MVGVALPGFALFLQRLAVSCSTKPLHNVNELSKKKVLKALQLKDCPDRQIEEIKANREMLSTLPEDSLIM